MIAYLVLSSFCFLVILSSVFYLIQFRPSFSQMNLISSFRQIYYTNILKRFSFKTYNTHTKAEYR